MKPYKQLKKEALKDNEVREEYLRGKINQFIRELNPYPGYLEKHHLTDGSEECFWADRNKKITEKILQEIKESYKRGQEDGCIEWMEKLTGLKKD